MGSCSSDTASSRAVANEIGSQKPERPNLTQFMYVSSLKWLLIRYMSLSDLSALSRVSRQSRTSLLDENAWHLLCSREFFLSDLLPKLPNLWAERYKLAYTMGQQFETTSAELTLSPCRSVATRCEGKFRGLGFVQVACTREGLALRVRVGRVEEKYLGGVELGFCKKIPDALEMQANRTARDINYTTTDNVFIDISGQVWVQGEPISHEPMWKSACFKLGDIATVRLGVDGTFTAFLNGLPVGPPFETTLRPAESCLYGLVSVYGVVAQVSLLSTRDTKCVPNQRAAPRFRLFQPDSRVSAAISPAEMKSGYVFPGERGPRLPRDDTPTSPTSTSIEPLSPQDVEDEEGGGELTGSGSTTT